MLRVVHDADAHTDAVQDVAAAEQAGQAAAVDLDELCRLAAREMIAVALEAERRAYLETHAHERDAAGKRLVVGNGYARERQITTAAGRVPVKAPRGGRPPRGREVLLGDPAAVHAPLAQGH